MIASFGDLLPETAPDLTPIYARLRALPALAPDARLADDRTVA